MDSGNFSLTPVEQSKKQLQSQLAPVGQGKKPSQTQFTPVDIRNKSFRRVFRGYDCDEVDRFLDDVRKEYEALYAENFDVREKTARYQSELEHYQQLENTLNQTMLLAQQTGEEVKQAARNEADLLLKEAEQEKEHRMAEAQVKLNAVQGEIEDLIRKRELIRTQLKSFLNAHLELTTMYDQEFEKN